MDKIAISRTTNTMNINHVSVAQKKVITGVSLLIGSDRAFIYFVLGLRRNTKAAIPNAISLGQ